MLTKEQEQVLDEYTHIVCELERYVLKALLFFDEIVELIPAFKETKPILRRAYESVQEFGDIYHVLHWNAGEDDE